MTTTLHSLITGVITAVVLALPAGADATSRGGASGAQPPRTHQTYTKTNPLTGEIYSGRTSGTGTPARNLAQRDAAHPWTARGFGPATLDRSSPNRDAIRGREQQLIEHYRATGRAADQINGVSPRNPKRDHYMHEAGKEFPK